MSQHFAGKAGNRIGPGISNFALSAAPVADDAKNLSAFVGGWKNWTRHEIRRSEQADFSWQREFFDHLLRSGESYAAKWDYVRNNPVRQRLVSTPDEWPYQGEIHTL